MVDNPLWSGLHQFQKIISAVIELMTDKSHSLLL